MLMWSLVWVISSVDAVQAKKHEGSWGGSAGGGNGGQGTEREVTAVPCRHLGRVSRPQAQVVPRPLGGHSF